MKDREALHRLAGPVLTVLVLDARRLAVVCARCFTARVFALSLIGAGHLLRKRNGSGSQG